MYSQPPPSCPNLGLAQSSSGSAVRHTPSPALSYVAPAYAAPIPSPFAMPPPPAVGSTIGSGSTLLTNYGRTSSTVLTSLTSESSPAVLNSQPLVAPPYSYNVPPPSPATPAAPLASTPAPLTIPTPNSLSSGWSVYQPSSYLSYSQAGAGSLAPPSFSQQLTSYMTAPAYTTSVPSFAQPSVVSSQADIDGRLRVASSYTTSVLKDVHLWEGERSRRSRDRSRSPSRRTSTDERSRRRIDRKRCRSQSKSPQDRCRTIKRSYDRRSRDRDRGYSGAAPAERDRSSRSSRDYESGSGVGGCDPLSEKRRPSVSRSGGRNRRSGSFSPGRHPGGDHGKLAHSDGLVLDRRPREKLRSGQDRRDGSHAKRRRSTTDSGCSDRRHKADTAADQSRQGSPSRTRRKVKRQPRSPSRDPTEPSGKAGKSVTEVKSLPNLTPEEIIKAEKQIWIRSAPADLYYERDKTNLGVMRATEKLIQLQDTFQKKILDFAKEEREKHPPLPPLKFVPTKHKHKHSADGNCGGGSGFQSSDSSSDSEDDENAFKVESVEWLSHRTNDPTRAHPEVWQNMPNELNDGPYCRCSKKASEFGIRHGKWVGETTPPPLEPHSNNYDKLYHYRVTISPPTNFLLNYPTVIRHDEHEFIFEGFSMFTTYKISSLPVCKVLRFNIEYNILYFEEKMPENFTIGELELFQQYLFKDLLELWDWSLDGRFYFMPRFVRTLSENGKEILSMNEVLSYLIKSYRPLVDDDKLEDMMEMKSSKWENYVLKMKGNLVNKPSCRPSTLRVDQLDRDETLTGEKKYPEIIHFGLRPTQLSYAGNQDYQKAFKEYVKFKHLMANMPKPTYKDRRDLEDKEQALMEMRSNTKLKRDATAVISTEGYYRTGLMADIVQHTLLLPVLVNHLRLHASLDFLEEKIKYKFKNRHLLQQAVTHPSYKENYGTNPDHVRNTLANCGIRQPEYGDKRVHFQNTRKRGINVLINIMSKFGKKWETESKVPHNERLEFLGDAVVEFITTVHLFLMFPDLEEGGLATYRAAIVNNQHLAVLAEVFQLERYMLYAHGSDLCHDSELRHAMANCFEALMGAIFLDGGIDEADRVFSDAMFGADPELFETWVNLPPHPLQAQEPKGDRHWIETYPTLQKLVKFENSIGIQFTHIRLLARAFSDRSLGFNNLTLGSNQRLEFLGDTVLQLITTDFLYKHFPEHHEGHLSLLRASLVNNRTQSVVSDDLGLVNYTVYATLKAEIKIKDRADILEAFLGALYIDKDLEYCDRFAQVCFFPRLQQFILNQDWNDPKSKLQQCCLTLRSLNGGEPDIPNYKVIECKGPTNTRIYTVAVYFRGQRLAKHQGHSIQAAEMNAAKIALEECSHLFPHLNYQKKILERSFRRQGLQKEYIRQNWLKESEKMRRQLGLPTDGDLTSIVTVKKEVKEEPVIKEEPGIKEEPEYATGAKRQRRHSDPDREAGSRRYRRRSARTESVGSSSGSKSHRRTKRVGSSSGEKKRRRFTTDDPAALDPPAVGQEETPAARRSLNLEDGQATRAEEGVTASSLTTLTPSEMEVDPVNVSKDDSSVDKPMEASDSTPSAEITTPVIDNNKEAERQSDGPGQGQESVPHASQGQEDGEAKHVTSLSGESKDDPIVQDAAPAIKEEAAAKKDCGKKDRVQKEIEEIEKVLRRKQEQKAKQSAAKQVTQTKSAETGAGQHQDAPAAVSDTDNVSKTAKQNAEAVDPGPEGLSSEVPLEKNSDGTGRRKSKASTERATEVEEGEYTDSDSDDNTENKTTDKGDAATEPGVAYSVVKPDAAVKNGAKPGSSGQHRESERSELRKSHSIEKDSKQEKARSHNKAKDSVESVPEVLDPKAAEREEKKKRWGKTATDLINESRSSRKHGTPHSSSSRRRSHMSGRSRHSPRSRYSSPPSHSGSVNSQVSSSRSHHHSYDPTSSGGGRWLSSDDRYSSPGARDDRYASPVRGREDMYQSSTFSPSSRGHHHGDRHRVPVSGSDREFDERYRELDDRRPTGSSRYPSTGSERDRSSGGRSNSDRSRSGDGHQRSGHHRSGHYSRHDHSHEETHHHHHHHHHKSRSGGRSRSRDRTAASSGHTTGPDRASASIGVSSSRSRRH